MLTQAPPTHTLTEHKGDRDMTQDIDRLVDEITGDISLDLTPYDLQGQEED